MEYSMQFDNLIDELKLCKEDIRKAIEYNNVSVNNDLTTYADAIRSIPEYYDKAIICVSGVKYIVEDYPEPITFNLRDIRSVGDMFNGDYYNGSRTKHINEYVLIGTNNVGNIYEGFKDVEMNTLSEIDASNLVDFRYMFLRGGIRNFGGFKDLGKRKDIGSCVFDGGWTAMTEESIKNIINKLYDRASAGYSIKAIKLSQSLYDKLTYNDISIATNKGWTIEVI